MDRHRLAHFAASAPIAVRRAPSLWRPWRHSRSKAGGRSSGAHRAQLLTHSSQACLRTTPSWRVCLPLSPLRFTSCAVVAVSICSSARPHRLDFDRSDALKVMKLDQWQVDSGIGRSRFHPHFKVHSSSTLVVAAKMLIYPDALRRKPLYSLLSDYDRTQISSPDCIIEIAPIDPWKVLKWSLECPNSRLYFRPGTK
jgi:hypothetical protein